MHTYKKTRFDLWGWGICVRDYQENLSLLYRRHKGVYKIEDLSEARLIQMVWEKTIRATSYNKYFIFQANIFYDSTNQCKIKWNQLDKSVN